MFSNRCFILCIYAHNISSFDTQDGPDTKTSNCQSRRAASICFSAIKFASSLKNETIVPDSFRGKPLCMDQFRVCVLFVCMYIYVFYHMSNASIYHRLCSVPVEYLN